MHPVASLAVATALVFFSPLRTAATALVVADSDFDLTQYDVLEIETGDVTPLPDPVQGSGTASVSRDSPGPSGAASDSFLNVRLEVFDTRCGPGSCSTGYGGVTAVIVRKDLVDPAPTGFAAIIHREQAKLFDLGGDGQATGVAIRQGGSVYVGRVECAPDEDWTTKTSCVEETSCVSAIPALNPLTPDRFVRIQGSGPLTPDLSPSGAPFNVGFFRAISGAAPGTGATRRAGIDDWRIVLLPPCATAADCEDGDGCTTPTCSAGVCLCSPVACNDDDPCTRDVCDSATGACPFPALPDGRDCGNADLCDGAETCLAGACVPGAALDCDDGDTCTVDGCAPTRGCRHDVSATYDVVDARLDQFLGLVSGRACGSEPLAKQLRRKVKKSVKRARRMIARADAAGRAEALDRFIGGADQLLEAARQLLVAAVQAGKLSPGCAENLQTFLLDLRVCVGALPRVP